MTESLVDYKRIEAADEYIALAALLNGVPGIGDLIPATALADPFCRQAFEAYRKSHSHNEAIDLARLAGAMGGGTAARDLAGVGLEYRAEEDHALSIVKLICRRHEGAKLAAELENNLSFLRYGYESDDAAARCRDALEQYNAAISGNDGGTSIADILRETGDMLLVDRRNSGRPFNIPTLDQKIGGLHGGEMLVIGARLKKGKTALAQTIAVEADLPTVIFSLEMSKREYLRNLVCVLGHIPSDELHDRLNEVDTAKEELRRRPIDIIDTPALTASEIAAACYARRGVKLVIVDHAQIIGRMRGADSFRESVAENVKAMKVLAKRLDAAVVLCSQIGRGGDEKPSVKDLAESDELGRSADHIMILDWDEDKAEPETRYSRPPVEATIKLTSRHMPSSSFSLDFHRSQRRFDEVRLPLTIVGGRSNNLQETF